MLKNYFKIAWRNMVKSKLFSFINIAGLAVGMAGAMLIFLWAFHEKSYDQFFSKSTRIYQLWSQIPVDGKVFSFEYSPEILAAELRSNVPEIETATSLITLPATSYLHQGKKMNIATALIDSSFFEVFDFKFVQGAPSNFLSDPMSVIVTEEAAMRLFGKTDILGQTLEVADKYPVKIAAILENLPDNTEFDFQVLLPWSLGKSMGHINEAWDSFEAETYVLAREKANISALTGKISSFMHPFKSDVAIDLYTLPLSKRHLQANFENGKPVGGKIILVNSFILVAFLLLAIACINFMNLSTAKSEKRAIEVGIRKVTGASRRSLIFQFLSEACLLTALSGLLACVMVFYLLPFFNTLTGQQMHLPIKNPDFWVLLVGFVCFTGLLSGSYPALLLSSFRPVRILKGSLITPKSRLSLRQLLTVIQFTVAITLIIGTSVIYQQIHHAQSRIAGYDRSQLLFTPLSIKQQQNFPAIKQALLNANVAASVSKTFAPVTDPDAIGNGYTWDGFTGSGTSSTLFISFATAGDLLKTTGIKLLAGRELDVSRFPTDSSAMMINEAAAKAMNMAEPLGKWVEREGKRWHIVGLVQDFVLESPFQKIKPLFITGPFTQMHTMHMKLSNRLSTADALAKMKSIFQKFDVHAPFSYQFADETYAQKFDDERRTARLSLLFSGLTIFISCLGLFGLAAYTAEKRSKEIGVRKVLGASVSNIVQLLSNDFMKLIGIAFIIAAPIAFFLMNKWLDDFDYRIAISWKVFILTGGLASAIAFGTVSLQAFKAAMANPVDSLRNE